MAERRLNSLTVREEEYLMKYGALPHEREELLSYVQEHFPFSQKSLDRAMAILEQLEWREIIFTLYLVPKPTPRPRTDGHHFYVKGAADNKKLIKKYIDRHVVATRCEVTMQAFLPTPLSQMSNVEIYLAEAGLIYPIHTADVDNLMKTYLDMITGHLIINDNLVTSGYLEKQFSVLPRLEVNLRYQTGYDSRYNEKRMLRSKSFQEVMSELQQEIHMTG